jgi:hypothetical protein
MSNVTPVVSTSTLKKSKRNQSPKKVAANITDQNVQKSSKKSEKSPAEKTPKISKTLIAKPIRDLTKVKFVPRWVYANIPQHLSEPSDQKFSFLALYLKVRDLAAAEGKPYFDLNVGQLIDLLLKYAQANPQTAIGEKMLNLKPLQMRDLRARLQWVACETLKRWDAQVREHQDAQKTEK